MTWVLPVGSTPPYALPPPEERHLGQLAPPAFPFTDHAYQWGGDQIFAGSRPWFDMLGGTGVDPTGVTDSTAGLQAQINAAQSAAGTGFSSGRGAALYLPRGIYKFSALTLPTYVSLFSAGGGAVLTSTSTSAPAITIQQEAGSANFDAPRLQNIVLKGPGSGSADGILVEGNNPAGFANGAARGYLLGVWVNGFTGGAGIRSKFSISMHMMACYLLANQTGLALELQSNAWTIAGCSFRSNQDGITISQSDGTFIMPSTVVEANTRYGVWLTGNQNVFGTFISGYLNKLSGTYDIFLDVAAPGTAQDTVIAGTINGYVAELKRADGTTFLYVPGATTVINVNASCTNTLFPAYVGSGLITDNGANTFYGVGRDTAGIATTAAYAANGLPGAQAASRYVGGTAGGAPATGTFLLGDFIIDQTGKVFVCTVAGTPGTWVQA